MRIGFVEKILVKEMNLAACREMKINLFAKQINELAKIKSDVVFIPKRYGTQNPPIQYYGEYNSIRVIFLLYKFVLENSFS